jgi:hypothetical protein
VHFTPGIQTGGHALGGLLALRDRRYQNATSPAASDAALAQG